jgi:nitrite reductase/ring-hydroxylating ferredoxin subunit
MSTHADHRADDAFEMVARLSDVPDGELLGVETSTGEKVCLANVRGQIFAMSDNCTHQDFPMSSGAVMPDGTIQCAWHGARFDCRTGAVRQFPAVDPLPVFEVRVDGDEILVGRQK